METIFLSQYLWKIVDEVFEENDREDDDSSSEEEDGAQENKATENVMKNAMALRILQQSGSKTIYLMLYSLKKAKEAWSVLKKEFQGSEKVISIKLQGLWRDFDNLAMKESETMKYFFSRVVVIKFPTRRLWRKCKEVSRRSLSTLLI
ncbi:hypothetical protein MLD38_021238 [Melastoma candidum]|uniref:Uncharacterized protein n=1 Tax=Melastoma candidum TaxID=119954 RepID=A0ACB9QGE7_9MYRT|nr:hypothetical protein MLD38_021238 [Melastoma candidum]